MRAVKIDNKVAYECINHPNYFINEYGNLYSIYVKGGQGRTEIDDPRLLAYGQDRDGYYRVVLSSNGKHKYIKVHTLMAEQFLGGVPEGMCVNHKDGNKQNNRLDNLEVVTPKENTQHAWKHGLKNVEQIDWRIPVDVERNGIITRCRSIQECCRLFSDITITYLDHLRTDYINTHDLKFVHVGGKNNYHVDVYRNSKLFLSFQSNQDAADYFGVHKNTISGLCHRKTAGHLFNQYYITFPNVSTIESTQETVEVSRVPAQ